jgi:hypothetical protein
LKHRIIVAIGEPVTLSILFDPKRHVHGVPPVQSVVLPLPRHWIFLAVVDEGRDCIVERLDDADIATLIRGPEAGGHFILTVLAAKRVNAGNDEVGVNVEDSVIVMSIVKHEGGHGIIP